MPIITSIKQQVKKDNRVSVYLDNKFGFGIDLDNFVILGLKVDQELTEEQISEIVKKAEFQKTLEKLLRFAMTRPRSCKEVTDWFKRKEVHESIHQELFEKLKYYELIGDEKFARWWIEQRISFRPRSQRLLKMELTQKGISREIAEAVLAEKPIDEVEVAYALALKKKSLVEKLPDENAKQKLIGFLARKGFGWQTIDAVLSKMVK